MAGTLALHTGGSRSASESDGAKVREGNQGIARLEVLDDPLSIEFLEGLALRGEGVCDGSALGRLIRSEGFQKLQVEEVVLTLETFSTTAVPAVVEVAVTVTT